MLFFIVTKNLKKLPKVDFLRCAVLRKRIDEFLNKSGCIFIKPNVPDCRINSLGELPLACVGRTFEVELCVFLKENCLSL